MTWFRKSRISVARLVALLMVAALVVSVWHLTRHPSDNRRGRAARLERFEFRAGPVSYTLPMPTIWQRLGTRLPDPVSKALGIAPPATTTVIVNPSLWGSGFPGEPTISAEFSWTVNSLLPGVGAARLVIADDQGNEFDPVVQGTAGLAVNAGREFWVGDQAVFPRRGREIRLRVMSNQDVVAEFRRANPARGAFPTWSANPLPTVAANGDLEVALVAFRAIQTSRETAESQRRYSRTECVFNMRQNHRETLDWRPISFEISDATGNHWRTIPRPTDEANNATVAVWFLGALWPGESAWKLRVEFKRVGDFPENEQLRLDNIRIPAANEWYQPHEQFEWNGANVELAAVIGKDVIDEQMFRLNAERKRGCITVVLGGQILSRQRQLTFVSASDEQGRHLNLAGPPREPDDPRSPVPFSFLFEPPADAHTLNLVVTVSASRFVEFIAKPEQAKE